MNLLSFLLLFLVAAGLWAALRYIKRHRSACGGSCAACGKRCKDRDAAFYDIPVSAKQDQ